MMFEKTCKGIFDFLEKEFDFKLSVIEKSRYGIYLVYQNATTAVKISCEPREGGIFILLIRLIEGKIPAYPIFIRAETTLNSFDLDDLIAVRAPAVKISKAIETCDSRDAELALMGYANALRNYASDILQGNFGVFAQLEQIVGKRALEE